MSTDNRIAPVQGYSAGIPWSLHLEAYDAYCKKYSKQPALIEGRCRGGFGIGELDEFIPGWRDRVSEIGQLRAQLAEAEAALQTVRAEYREDAELWRTYIREAIALTADAAELHYWRQRCSREMDLLDRFDGSTHRQRIFEIRYAARTQAEKRLSHEHSS